jgi:outer membrane protein assembly factor BamB
LKINVPQFSRRYWFVSGLLLLLLLVSACGSNTESWPGVVGDVESDTVIFSFNKVVTSLSSDNSRNWIYEYDGAKFYAPALITDDLVYVGDFDGRFHAIRREDGEAAWVYESERQSFFGLFDFGSSDRVIAPAEAGNGFVFFGTEQGVFALRSDEDGDAEIVWEFDKPDQSVWARPLYIDDPELVDEPLLIVAALDKRIYALNPETGDEEWVLELSGAVASQPTVDTENGVLYAGTLNSILYAIDLNGEVVAEYHTEGWVWGNPTIYEGALYFGDLNGHLYALRYIPDEGFESLWTKELDTEALRPSPAIADDVLVIPSEGQKVFAVNLEDQSIKWTNDGLDAKVLSEMFIVETDEEPLVIMGTDQNDRVVVALSLNDGSTAWEYEYQENED